MAHSKTDLSFRERYGETYWNRQANPNSGLTRLATGPLLMYALYRRSWRLAAATVVFSLLNPLLFSERTEDSDSWFTRASRASEAEIGDGVPVFSGEWPAVLNVLNLPVFLYALYSALAQRPARTATATALFVGLKLWYLNELVTDYDERKAAE
ncbi:hypothetical protein SAMN04487950_1664 [Halogranum rubrum]|uniref:Uncharacterized protein n=1 Tax=Halogranum rubrum TaxID=553466 RepID=A0A1I4D5N0_9EURY|nr:DUF6653 family protein [Halogranum rubrum]SFK88898.1 hypothetical protein SAMN04487950_1664 [Halogranum rubrum]